MKSPPVNRDTSQLSAEDRLALLRAAREALETFLTTGEYPELGTRYRVERAGAAFVTLKKGVKLRGCIGHLNWDRPLLTTVVKCAVAAATQDPRFPRVSAEEVSDLEIEISVLGTLREIRGPEEIEIGRHGVLVSVDYQQGLLLPQVAVELNLTPLQFLELACGKALLPAQAWEQGARIQVFEAEVFSSADA